MKAVFPGLLGSCIVLTVAGLLCGEQLTSTCRITVVDSAHRTVTLVRETASGEKIGLAKVAATAKVTMDSRITSLESLAPPVGATVVFDTDAMALVEIRVKKVECLGDPRYAGERAGMVPRLVRRRLLPKFTRG